MSDIIGVTGTEGQGNVVPEGQLPKGKTGDFAAFVEKKKEDWKNLSPEKQAELKVGGLEKAVETSKNVIKEQSKEAWKNLGAEGQAKAVAAGKEKFAGLDETRQEELKKMTMDDLKAAGKEKLAGPKVTVEDVQKAWVDNLALQIAQESEQQQKKTERRKKEIESQG